MCLLPRRCVDVIKHEVARFLRLTTDSVEPVSFYCPRRSELFQADIYPDCFAGIPSAKADDFFSTEDNSTTDFGPVLRPMNPEDPNCVQHARDLAQSPGNGRASPTELVKKKSKKELQAELETAKNYIKTLSTLLEQNNLDVPDPPPGLEVMKAD